MTKPHVCVIILNWNGLPDTLDCLNSISSLKTRPDSVVVCDNGSTDGSPAGILSWAREHFDPVSVLELEKPATILSASRTSACPAFVLIQNKSNLGFAGGNNTGIRFVLSQNFFDFVWLLNNDTIVHPHALDALLNCADHYRRAGVFGSTIVYEEDRQTVQCAGGCRYNPATTIVRPAFGEKPLDQVVHRSKAPDFDYVYGASMFVRAEVFEKCGLLNERYFLFYEEIDFCTRAKSLGYELAWCPKSIIYHKSGKSITGDGPSRRDGAALANYHENLSPLLYTQQFHPRLLPFSMIFRLIGKLAMIVIRRQWYLIRPLAAAYKDFLKHTPQMPF